MLQQLMANVGEKEVHYLQAFVTAMITCQVTAGLIFGIGAYFQDNIDAAKNNGAALFDTLYPIIVSAGVVATIFLAIALRTVFNIKLQRSALISFVINGTNTALLLSIMQYLSRIELPK